MKSQASGLFEGSMCPSAKPQLTHLTLLLSCVAIVATATPALRPLWWHAPFFSGGGYSSEAISFAIALHRFAAAPKLWISQHGDAFNPRVLSDLLPQERDTLLALAKAAEPRRAPPSVVVCHSEPGAWSVPKPLFSTTECPPRPRKGQHFVVGRTMFETDRLTEEHVRRCNKMDEVWVPTHFNFETFANAGVERRRCRLPAHCGGPAQGAKRGRGGAP
mmetsp:Transcript_21458/g.38187  ORF Transcript_21458/g.38187 Transcript_21458/m.38187 type:complete len:218 (+) Transcript_21458:39-692(+)